MKYLTLYASPYTVDVLFFSGAEVRKSMKDLSKNQSIMTDITDDELLIGREPVLRCLTKTHNKIFKTKDKTHQAKIIIIFDKGVAGENKTTDQKV